MIGETSGTKLHGGVGACTVTGMETTTDITTLTGIAQEMIRLELIAENLHRIARGDSYCPTTAEERADTAKEAAGVERAAAEYGHRLTAAADSIVAQLDADGGLGEYLEGQAEVVAEIESEAAHFGDSGPGTMAILVAAAAIRQAVDRLDQARGPRPFDGFDELDSSVQARVLDDYDFDDCPF